MQKLNCLIVVGSRIGLNEQNQMVCAKHTEMKAHAAGIAWQEKLTEKFLFTGGHCIGVRYARDLSVPTFGSPESTLQANYSETAKMLAHWHRSEASVMAELVRKDYAVPPYAIVLEEDSETTAQNAEFCRDIICGMFGEKPDGISVGILSLLYHMQRAMQEFCTAFASIANLENIQPVFAEEILAMSDFKQYERVPMHTMDDFPVLSNIDHICKYYSTPKGGNQYDTDRIRKLLVDGKSLEELMQPDKPTH